MTIAKKLSTEKDFPGRLSCAPCGLENTTGKEGNRSYADVRAEVTLADAVREAQPLRQAPIRPSVQERG